MPKQHDQINEFHREAIRRQLGLLRIAIDAAALGLRYFTPHGQALADLRKTIKETENILRDRPRDFQRWNTTPGPRLARPPKSRTLLRRGFAASAQTSGKHMKYINN
jgi:hypothetical protein